jgi:gliotoxin/aspirochlorine biosynthesis thioredoxin reductase
MTRPGDFFAEELGIKLSPTGEEYEVPKPFNATNVPGIFANGDTASMSKVSPNAIVSGANDAADIATLLQEEKRALSSVFS